MATFDPTRTQVFSDVACTVCGCVCDDLQVTFFGERVSHVVGACGLAEPWFASLADSPSRPPVYIDGQSATLAEAIHHSADILRRSRSPLIWGLSRSSTAAVRAAFVLAEQIGATLDTTASVGHGPTIVAMQQAGESTCSLGEVRNRADLVIFWGADPMETHPRLLGRYAVDPAGLFVSRGRSDRTVIVVDTKETSTSRLADTFIKIPRYADFEVIWTIRQLLRGLEVPLSGDLGASNPQLKQLAEQMKSCRYGALFFGLGTAQTDLGHADAEALLRLVADLNDHTRFTAHPLQSPGNVAGADAALCWLTGFPFAVSMSRGYPRYNPGEYSANEMLERGEVDACLLVGSQACRELSLRARRALERLPTIALDYPNAQPAIEAAVQITTAVYGIHAAGTACRLDGVPIPLRHLVPSDYPTDESVLREISACLR